VRFALSIRVKRDVSQAEKSEKEACPTSICVYHYTTTSSSIMSVSNFFSSLLRFPCLKNSVAGTTWKSSAAATTKLHQQQPLQQLLYYNYQQVTTRYMSKYLSKAARKRIPLTTKRASRGGFYKGKGSTKEGRLTSKGKFVVDPLKRLELVVPDLTGFKVCVCNILRIFV
jgi:Mitochondrial ribosomal protein L27